ncbi:MAG TPA: exodeoxyribonuclease VII large subunit, partial [Ilumatobacteraceae bacterium]|nr:exodeoxyribonuclease VII large subunit [Ilumatobacteraceae bacterium]
TYSVSELAEAINARLRGGFYDGVWVRGEIQGYRAGGPHRYFRLVENGDDGKASINVSLFAPMINKLRPMLERSRLKLVDGLKVRIYGHLDFFAPSGSLGLKMAGIDTRFTIGDIEQQRQDTIRRLIATGLYDANRRLPLSPVPLRVGVVTSADSAAWADFRSQLEAAELGFYVRLIHCRVQGDQAVQMVSAAIRTLGRCADLDVVVVIRGGGARSELATFDHPAIATAIARSSLPVFTGLGHEIDSSVADEVAQRRLKTPTAVAAELIEMVQQFSRQTELCFMAIHQRAARSVESQATYMEHTAVAIHRLVAAAVQRSIERLELRQQRVDAGVTAALERAAQRLNVGVQAVGRTAQRIPNEVRHLDSIASRVRLLDPVHTMARGWSITRTTDGRVVRSAADLQPGQQIVTAFAAGTATSTVDTVQPSQTESDADG